MTEKQIWDKIQSLTNNKIFTAALMGNMKAESALRGNNLQNSYEKKLGYTDLTYTYAIDQRKYSLERFKNDGAGYGLCQWTSSGRKEALYKYWEKFYPIDSIANESMQIDFCIYELTQMDLYDQLKSCNDLRSATAIILRKYERPADQSDANVDRRTSYADAYYKTYGNVEEFDIPLISKKDLMKTLKGLMDQLDCAQGIMDDCMEKIEHVMEELVD